MLYAIASGPLLWVSVGVFLGGLAYRTYRLWRLTEPDVPPSCPAQPPMDRPARTPPSEEECRLDAIARFQNGLLGKHPVMTIVSGVFHACLWVTPFLVMAHNVLIRKAVGIAFPSLPDGLTHLLTAVVLACAVFFLVRRMAVPKVTAISGVLDYAVLAVTTLPFLTGFLAHEQWLDYRTVITVHALAGDLMLIAVPFTKVGHMAFFFVARFAMKGEACLLRGSRTWAG